MDPQARARALEALCRRLDGTLPRDERFWPAIAGELGYPSGDAAKRAAWRTFNRHCGAYLEDVRTFDELHRLAAAIGFPPDTRSMRRVLRELDERKAPEDADPPKPPKPRKLTKTALREAILQRLQEQRNTVDADPDPRAIVVFPFATSQETTAPTARTRARLDEKRGETT